MTDFNLPWKASQEALSTSWRIKAYSRSSSNFKLSSESWRVLQTLLSRIDHTEKSRGFKSGLIEGHSSLLMNVGMWVWIQLWVILEPCDVRSLVEKSKVHHQSATCPGKQFSFQNVRNVTLAVQFHSWGYKNEYPQESQPAQWLWLPPTPSQKVDSGVCLLSCLPLIHLYSKLSFWWFNHCWASNFVSSVNTK